MPSPSPASTHQTYYTVNEVADLIKRHHVTVRRWIKDGRVKSVRLGGRIQVPEEEVNKLLVGVSTDPVDAANFRKLEDRTYRLEDTMRMLLERFGYGNALEGMGDEGLTVLVHRGVTLAKKQNWSLTEKDELAEQVLRLRDPDVRSMTVAFGQQWVVLYNLMVHMRTDTKSGNLASQVTRAKLDRAQGHLRTLVFAVERTTGPDDRFKVQLAKVSQAIGADVRPTTFRVLGWIEAEAAAA